jgi:hypothetical protein
MQDGFLFERNDTSASLLACPALPDQPTLRRPVACSKFFFFLQIRHSFTFEAKPGS